MAMVVSPHSTSTDIFLDIPEDIGLSVKKLKNSEDCIVTGYFTGTITFFPLDQINSYSNTNSDIFVARIDTDIGEWIWAKNAGYSNQLNYVTHLSQSISIMNDDSIIISGIFTNKIEFTKSIILEDNSNTSTLFVAKLTQNGEWVWAIKGGDNIQTILTYGLSIPIIDNKYLYITTIFLNETKFGNLPKIIANGPDTFGDIFNVSIAKLDINNDNPYWTNCIKIDGYYCTIIPTYITTDSKNIYLVGNFNTGYINLDKIYYNNRNSNDGFLARLYISDNMDDDLLVAYYKLFLYYKEKEIEKKELLENRFIYKS